MKTKRVHVNGDSVRILPIFPERSTLRGNDLLLKVKEHILDVPERIVMEIIQISRDLAPDETYDRDIMKGEELVDCERVEPDFPECGTVACIAGWTDAIVLGGVTVGSDCGSGLGSLGRAQHFLNLNCDEADSLFYVYAWGKKFRDKYVKAETAKERAEVVADRIDHFIKTRE